MLATKIEILALAHFQLLVAQGFSQTRAAEHVQQRFGVPEDRIIELLWASEPFAAS